MVSALAQVAQSRASRISPTKPPSTEGCGEIPANLAHTLYMAWLSLLSARSRTDILVVCTGNVCRSPYIAALLGAGLPEMTITSAGIRAAVGERPGSDILRALALRNINADFVPSQNVTTRMVRNARLIVTATRMHRVKVVALDPSACARAFTLKELARSPVRNTRDGAWTRSSSVAPPSQTRGRPSTTMTISRIRSGTAGRPTRRWQPKWISPSPFLFPRYSPRRATSVS